jgi:hypothetical protein
VPSASTFCILHSAFCIFIGSKLVGSAAAFNSRQSISTDTIGEAFQGTCTALQLNDIITIKQMKQKRSFNADKQQKELSSKD